jgi:peptide deformylase
MQLQYKLIPYDDPLLTKPMEYKDLDNKEEFAKNLESATRFLNGIGLSANQVGIDNRIFSIVYGDFAETFFDPKIIEYSPETILFEEGCLSQPGVFISLKRPQKIKIEYTTRTGERITAEYGGITARIIQHEYDHMEGTNFLNMASPLKKALALKKAKSKKRYKS